MKAQNVFYQLERILVLFLKDAEHFGKSGCDNQMIDLSFDHLILFFVPALNHVFVRVHNGWICDRMGSFVRF
jgi:hypothetical protein